MRTRTFAWLAMLSALLAVSACASAAAGGGGVRQRTDLITRVEIEGENASSLYELVERLRPRWLQVRSPTTFGIGAATNQVVVYQDQTLLGGAETLRQLKPDVAFALRYLDGPTASATLPGLGSRRVEGAIVVQTTAQARD